MSSKIKDPEKFLSAMHSLCESVDHVGCGDLDSYLEYMLDGLDAGMSDIDTDSAQKRRASYEKMFRAGPVFIFFDNKELLKTVQDYIVDQDLRNACNCGENEACSRCPK
jgi:hypothetical protein